MISIKDFIQQQKYSCWPASIRIAQHLLWREKKYDEKHIAQLCWVTKFRGTSPFRLHEVLKVMCANSHFKPTYTHWKDWVQSLFTWWNIPEWICIVLYMVDCEKSPYYDPTLNKAFGPHFAVVKNINFIDERITVYNPFGLEEIFSFQERKNRRWLTSSYMDMQDWVLKLCGLIKPFSIITIN